MELILSSIEVNSPTKDEIHTLIGNAPSLRYLSEMNEGALRMWADAIVELNPRRIVDATLAGNRNSAPRRSNEDIAADVLRLYA